jgi:hypothetical protein
MSTPQRKAFLTTLYAGFNARRIDDVLAALHPDVEWPNGWKGGWLRGRDAVRDYWTRQWSEIDPHVEPVAFADDDEGRVVVTVHAVIRAHDGELLSDGVVLHVYAFDDGLVRRMDIRAQ